MKGVFYGVGVGPGDPELITLKGYRVLREADVICSPRSGDGREGVALSVVSSLLTGGQQVLELPFPMTRDRAELEACWSRAAGKIIGLLDEGKKVAFITLGDPALYSTYTYVLRKVREAGDYETVTVPGVASFSACAAAAGIPLAEGDEKLAVIPTVKDLNAVRFALQNFESVVLMKVAGRFDRVVEILTELGLKDRAVYASRCGLPGGTVEYDLDEVRERDYLSLIIVKSGEKRAGCER